MAHAKSLCVLVLLCIQGKAAKAPNVVFILADDLGYNEMNWMNSTRGLHTPNLDALAHEGVILKNYYGTRREQHVIQQWTPH